MSNGVLRELKLSGIIIFALDSEVDLKPFFFFQSKFDLNLAAPSQTLLLMEHCDSLFSF